VVAVRLSCELEGQGQAKPQIIVAVRRVVVVAIGGAAVLRIVEVAAAANNAMQSLWRLTYIFKNDFCTQIMGFSTPHEI